MKKIDFLAIGDTVIDTFIKLEDAHIHSNIDKEGRELCVPFGGKIPYESINVIPGTGNSANASVCASNMGLNSFLVANIGNDENGKNCINSFKKKKVSTKYLTKQKDKKTSHNYILWYEVDRTILTQHTEFDYKLPKIKKVDWVYLSSLAQNSLEYNKEIVNFLEKNPKTKLAFQPGTSQIKLGTEKLKNIYNHTEIFFSNKEEAGKILNIENAEIIELSRSIKALGPKIVVISDGVNGAYMYYENELYHLPIYPDSKASIESTGAGDAFSATITCALALGKNPLEAFTWGPVNAMSVVQKIGAQEGLLSREKIEEYLKNAPENYKIQKIS